MLLTFQGMIDEQFVEGIRDKSRRGSFGSLERGFTPGGNCYGYKNVAIRDPNKKGLYGENAVIGVKQEILHEEAETLVLLAASTLAPAQLTKDLKLDSSVKLKKEAYLCKSPADLVASDQSPGLGTNFIQLGRCNIVPSAIRVDKTSER